MKTTLSLLFAAALSLSSVPAHATKLDLATMSCKQFVENAKQFGIYCGKNPNVSIVTAADEVLGK